MALVQEGVATQLAENNLLDLASRRGLVEWDASLTLGYKPVDADHVKLLDFVNEFFSGLVEGEGMAVALAQFDPLVKHITDHFRLEEQLMKEFGYPESLSHMAVHNLLETQLQKMREDVSNGEAVISAQTMQFLKVWLVTHIQTLDKTLCDYLAKCPDKTTANKPVNTP
jgi:hemerythrin